MERLNIHKLKGLLRDRNLKTSGNKDQLINRLKESGYKCDIEGNKYENMTVIELKKLSAEKMLRTSGPKNMLIFRLRQNDTKKIINNDISQRARTKTFLTNVPDVDMIILLMLDDRSLRTVCNMDEYSRQICDREIFWMEKITHRYKCAGMPIYKYVGNKSYREIYEAFDKKDAYMQVKLAVEIGFLPVLIYNIEAGYDLHRYENILLRWACLNGYLDIVKYLVEKGAKVNVKQEDPLKQAISFGSIDIVEYLIEKGANIGMALLYAIQKGRLKIVEYLLDKNVTINDEHLSKAAKYNRSTILQLLIDKGANITNNTIKNAIRKSNCNMVEYLIENRVGEYNYTWALNMAIMEGALNIIEYLIRKDTKIDNSTVDRIKMSNNLDIMIYFHKRGVIDIFEKVKM